MACLWTTKVTLCSSSVCLLLLCITYVCVGVDILKALMYGPDMCECTCVVRVPKNLWKEGKTLGVCLYCLSLAVSLYQAGSLTKARDPCHAVLDNCTWSEYSSETKRDLRKQIWIRNTSSDLLPQSAIRAMYTYVCASFSHTHTHTLCFIRLQSRSHTDLFLHHGNGEDPGSRPDWQSNTKPPIQLYR